MFSTHNMTTEEKIIAMVGALTTDDLWTTLKEILAQTRKARLHCTFKILYELTAKNSYYSKLVSLKQLSIFLSLLLDILIYLKAKDEKIIKRKSIRAILVVLLNIGKSKDIKEISEGDALGYFPEAISSLKKIIINNFGEENPFYKCHLRTISNFIKIIIDKELDSGKENKLIKSGLKKNINIMFPYIAILVSEQKIFPVNKSFYSDIFKELNKFYEKGNLGLKFLIINFISIMRGYFPIKK